MNSIYHTLSTTKQAFHQRLNLQIRREEELEQLLPILRDIREDHPFMSSRQMYIMIQPETIGRDRFESFCFERGFKIVVKRNFRKTTNSLGVTRFENLINQIELKHVNQVLVSDITYYEIAGRFYFLTFIMDLFSRRILGYNASKNMFTESTTIPALKMVTKVRKDVDLSGLIFHSDGGGQYYCKEFLKLTKKLKFKNSMCKNVYENPHAERVNGTIKNAYLEGYKPQNFEALKRLLTKAVYMYNHQKPHEALNGLSPVCFEQYLLNIKAGQRYEMTKGEKNGCMPATQAEFFSSSLPLIKGRINNKKELANIPAPNNLPRHVGRSLQSGCSPAEPDQLIIKQ